MTAALHKPRDSQRGRVYRAEAVVRGTTFTGPVQVADYVGTVTSSSWWREHTRGMPVRLKLREAGKRGFAHANGMISLPRFAWYEGYILHELAHLVSGVKYGWIGVAFHGPEFVAILHDMIAEFLGEEAASAYRLQCCAKGVRGCPGTMPAPDTHEHSLAAGPTPRAALTAYADSYRRYRRGERSSTPKLRKGMTPEEASVVRQGVDREFAYLRR